MKARSIFIVGFLLSSLFVFCIVLTEPSGQCDPSPYPLKGVTLEGAHIVSEGAYFRFWIFNNNSFSINVAVNGVDIPSVPPESGIDYDMIAPQTSMPYEQVTYKFVFSSEGEGLAVDYTVLVLNSSFVQIFDLIVPILIAIATIILVVIAFVILKRRRVRIKQARTLSVRIANGIQENLARASFQSRVA